mgnify:CR=1 FL=1
MTEQWKKYYPEIVLNDGEVYAGLVISDGGHPQFHLILAKGEISCCTWQTADLWAKSKRLTLPTRSELYILHANLKSHFKPSFESQLCYWSSDTGGDIAGEGATHYFHSFKEGIQCEGLDGYGMNACAVRRVAVPESINSDKTINTLINN